jgi:hypothetical protein
MQQFPQFIILTFIYSSTCFGRHHAHHQELDNCNSSLWFYLWSVIIAVLLVVVGPVITGKKRQDNKLEKFLHLDGDLFELYDDARTYKL